MRRRVLDALGLGVIIVLAVGCTGDPDTADAPAQPGSGEVTGGEIIVSGDLAAGTPGTDPLPPPDDAQAPPPSAAAATTTTEPVASADRPSATTTSTSPPPSAPAPPSTSPATTEPAVIGDGPVLGGIDTSETPAIGVGLVPVFFVLDATTTVGCADGDPGTVRLRWEVIGTESVDIAIGTKRDVVAAGQPPAGTLDVALDCAAGSRYFVVAANPEGESVRSISVGAE